MPPMTRQANLAGSWYPATADECLRLFRGFESEAQEPQRIRQPIAGIVPHAGWVFSGSIAFNVLQVLAKATPAPDTVVLFAGHLAPDAQPTVMAEGACETPFGLLDADNALAHALLDRAPTLVAESARHHTQDNSAELQLPMIKHHFPKARVLIIGAPPAPLTLRIADALVDAADALSRRLVFVGSTDLTHYGPNYRFSPQGHGPDAEVWVRDVNDREFLDLAVTGETGKLIEIALSHRNACCPGAAAAAIHCARRARLAHEDAVASPPGEFLRYATSADIRPATSFVGYGGIIF
ncbi:MAG: AmmeMemoRadiSam system protein B [Deltaproteobacteria bacterium]|nr:AmmeMemoRadiSam system protein B [Deltaproteobacteria bacterium]